MNTEDTQKSNTTIGPAIAVLVLLIVLIRGLPFYFPDGRVWGVNHLLFVDDYFTVIFGLGVLLALLGFVPAVRDRLTAACDRLAGVLFESPRPGRWLIVGAASITVFWTLRMPTNLLGDGYSIINNIADDIPVIFKWSEIGAVRLIHFVSRLLPLQGLVRGEYALALVSVVSGAVTLYFFFGIAYELADDSPGRLFVFGLLIFSGWMLLFFGYAENYPILWPFMTAYLYFGLRYLHAKSPLIWPTLCLLAALVLHLQTLFFLISYPILLISRGRLGTFYRRHSRALMVAAGMVFLTGIIAFMYKYQTSLSFQVHFLPPFFGRPATPDYAMFSPTHLLDILNQMSLLIPVWPILLTGAILGWKQTKRDPVGRFLAAFSIGGGVFIFLVDPRIGLGRDWDLFALTGLAPMLYLARRFLLSPVRRSLSLPAVAFLSLVLVFPYFAANLSYQPSIDYMKSLLRLDMPRSKPGIVMLRDYYSNIGNERIADSLNRETIINFPLVRMADRIHGLALSGRLDEALVLADSVYRADPYSPETHNVLGMVHFKRGEYRRAIELFEQSSLLKPYDHRVQANLASAYQQLGDPGRMMEYLRKVQKLAPQSHQALEGLAMAFHSLRQYDSAFYYAQELLRVDAGYATGYLAAGLACLGLRDAARAKRYLSRYVELAPDCPEKTMAIETLKKLE